MTSKKILQETPILKVPSSNPLTYCRLCFTTKPCKKIASQEDALHWIDYIQRTVGIEMNVELDTLFAICFGCKLTLESVEQFRFTCRMHDTALKRFREQANNSNINVPLITSNTDGGESSNATVAAKIASITEDSADESKDTSSSAAVENVCLVCDMKFPTLLEYKKHMKKTHGKYGGIVSCPLCSRRFRKDILFQRHVLKHTDKPMTLVNGMHPGKQKKCRFCGKIFCTGKELRKHEQEKHGLPFECRLCFKRFANEQDKNAHEELLHLAGKGEARRTRFKCKICSRVFPNRHCLNIHAKKHEKCFMCWTCQEEFDRVDTYVKHRTTVHQCNTILEECSECQVVFNSRDEFHNHLNMRHAAYRQDLANDEFSASDADQPNGIVKSATKQSAQLQQLVEPETVSVSSDDFPIYMEDDEQDGTRFDEQESSRRGAAITSRLEEELMLEEVPRDTGFDLYGTAFQPQISEPLIEVLSD